MSTMESDKREIPWHRAEVLLGRRVNRRRKYAALRDPRSHRPVVCSLARWSDACSGCNETPEYGGDPYRGMGCSECGYTGRRRWAMWLPVPETLDQAA